MSTSLGSSKKGNIKNYFVVILFMLAFGIIIPIGAVILYSIVDAWKSTEFWEGKLAEAGNSFLAGYAWFDWISVLIVIAFFILIIMTSYKIKSAPIYFVISIIVGILFTTAAWVFNYIFSQFITNEALTAITYIFPKTILICTNLHWIALGLIIVGGISMYAKGEVNE